ncbi:MAG: ribose-phosphate pyrophosphokinase [Chloroflexi bacterium]|nr:ribose-phosphate pyrophosphokinase [Chloroflexota bacterium]
MDEACRFHASYGGGIAVTHGRLALYAGSANPELAAAVAGQLGISLGRMRLRHFPDGEVHVQIEESIRGRDVYLLQSTGPPVNEHLMELLVMIDAFHRASAGRLTAVIPYYGYSRQEKKSTGREPISAKLVADLLTCAGVQRVVSIDLHTPAIQGFFDIGMDHLTAVPILIDYLVPRRPADGVVVAPDVGRAKLADKYATSLGLPMAIVYKEREPGGLITAREVVGEVSGRTPIVIDDMISTGSTIERAVEVLLRHGAKPAIVVAVTHPVLVGPAIERLAHPAIHEVVVTDTIPIPPEKRLPKLHVRTVASLLAEAIGRLHREESISAIFRRPFTEYGV